MFLSDLSTWKLSATELRARFLGNDNKSKPLSESDTKSDTSILGLIEAQIKRGSPGAFWDALRNQNGVGLNDRKMILEEVLILMARLPPGSQLGLQVERFMIDFLYKDLPHPPATFLAPITPLQTHAEDPSDGMKSFAWRTPDGRNNNPLIPHLGAAHTPYARSVSATHPLPQYTLPDPGLVFDTLLRRNKNVNHPTGLSTLFFAFANIIIHSLFDTNRSDWRINDTSSYLDLSPLYGVDMDEQKTVRRFDGTGRLYDDTFADIRMLGMPPPVPALLVVFNRNHNFIADRILRINEYGKYEFDPLPSDPKKLRDQDDEIFNRARLVNAGAFMQAILHDYVGCILHMTPDINPWYLDALAELRDSSHDILPRGEGNVCSVEFNLLYRWHATTSEKEEKWLDEFSKRVFPNKSYDEITVEQFGPAVARELLGQGMDPRKWTFGGHDRLSRDPTTGRLSDKDLAETLQDATDDMAQAFRARGIPAVFRVIEILGIKQARAWNVCSLNEFRKFLGLRAYSSFQEWNPDAEISAAAERLYHDIDNLELFVGMQAEETRPSISGSGLCSGYTMSRSILADAVALVRGDRFSTTECTPQNLTSWGFQDIQTTPDNGSLGGILAKLLFRALPNHYLPGSVYAHFPFIVPTSMRQFMQKKNSDMVKKYNWERVEPISTVIPTTEIMSIKEILGNSSTFFAPYQSRMATLTKGHGFYFGGADSSKNQKIRELVLNVLFTPSANTSHADFFYQNTLELLVNKSYQTGPITRTVDIVQEVINCVFVYLNNRPANAWFLEQNAKKAAKEILSDIFSLSGEIEKVAGSLNRTLSKLTKQFKHHDEDVRQTRHAFEELKNMFKNNTEELSYNVFGILVNCVANWSHAMVHVVNFYLDPSRKEERNVISNLASSGRFSELEEAQFRGYVREALRLDPPISGVLRESHSAVSVQEKQIASNGRVYLNLAKAYKNENMFGNPYSVTPQRVLSDKVLSLFVPGAHSSLNEEFSEKTMAQTLRAIFNKKNLRRGPGPSGKLARFTEETFGAQQTLYLDMKGQVTMWPQTMVVQDERVMRSSKLSLMAPPSDPRDPSLEVPLTLPKSWTKDNEGLAALSMLLSGGVMVTRNRYFAWPALIFALSGYINTRPLRTKEGGQGLSGIAFALAAMLAAYLPYLILPVVPPGSSATHVNLPVN
ncbi:hypothetical protein Clacol_008963 [Clathrus columnatus]|uniref:Heme peroxidase n=1 Tax=Clathrus columnatus TaxID=1419009 RepID=A0AAV5AP76_9AGAM|nr:hypothetical protein Clacol_008963 [Clathrus columnatus]